MESNASRSCVARFAVVLFCLQSVAAPAAQPLPASTGSVRLEQLPQSWRDDRNGELALANLSGHPVVLTMAYAGCHTICPTVFAELKRLQLALDARGEYVNFVIVGYDPENEGPATWRQYRIRHQLNAANWHFLSGSRDDTEQLAHQLGFDFWKYDEHVMHDSRVLVFDSRGLLGGELNPDPRHWPTAL